LSSILSFAKALNSFNISSVEQIFMKVFLACIYTAILLLVMKEFKFIQKRHLPVFTLFAFVFSIFIFSAISSVVMGAPIAIAVSLIYTQPFYTMLIAHFSGEEKMTPLKVFLIIIAIIGVVLVTGLTLEQILGLQISAGIFFGLAAGLLYAFYLKIKRSVKKLGYSSSQMLFNTTLIMVPMIFVWGYLLSLVAPNPALFSVVIPQGWQWLVVLAFGVFGLALPYGILNKVDPKEITPTGEGLLLLLDPTMNVVWSILIWQQFVTPIQYLGVAIIIVAAAVNVLKH
jgi:drug/metabolite transporter (DMT)-like permease